MIVVRPVQPSVQRPLTLTGRLQLEIAKYSATNEGFLDGRERKRALAGMPALEVHKHCPQILLQQQRRSMGSWNFVSCR